MKKLIKVEENKIFISKENFSYLNQEIIILNKKNQIINTGFISEIKKDKMSIILNNPQFGVNIEDIFIFFFLEDPPKYPLFISPKNVEYTFDFDSGIELMEMKKINLSLNSKIINPIYRDVLDQPIFTGISAIDLFNTIIKGQKIAFFTLEGMNTIFIIKMFVSQLKKNENMILINSFISYDGFVVDELKKFFFENDVLDKVSFFSSFKTDLLFKKKKMLEISLSYAEKMAFNDGKDVILIIDNICDYAEILKTIGNIKEEIPGRMGYPFYLYSEFASIYERAGKIKNKKGSLTIIPFLKIYNDDITHVIPDVTGYISEGQIIFDRILFNRGYVFPIDINKSFSRLKKHGTGKNKTFEGHTDFYFQTLYSYSKAKEIEELSLIKGMEEMDEIQLKYLQFKESLEEKLINQKKSRTFEDSKKILFEILSILPKVELIKLDENMKKIMEK